MSDDQSTTPFDIHNDMTIVHVLARQEAQIATLEAHLRAQAAELAAAREALEDIVGMTDEPGPDVQVIRHMYQRAKNALAAHAPQAEREQEGEPPPELSENFKVS